MAASDLEALRGLPDRLRLNHQDAIRQRLVDRWWALTQSHPTETALVFGYYEDDGIAAAINTSLRQSGAGTTTEGVPRLQRIVAQSIANSVQKIAQELPVGLSLRRILSDGLRETASGAGAKSTCGAAPDTRMIQDMRAMLAAGGLPPGTILQENGLMSTALGRSAHHELADCTGIEFHLVAGPGVRGVAIAEQESINDVVFLPGQKIAVLGTQEPVSGQPDRLIVSAVLLPTDAAGGVRDSDRSILDVGYALRCGDLPAVERVVAAQPEVICCPNVLAGYSAQTYALHRLVWGGLQDASRLANSLRNTARNVPGGAHQGDWFGQSFTEQLATLANEHRHNGKVLARLLDVAWRFP